MIENHAQLVITRGWIARFETACADLTARGDADPNAHLVVASMESQLETLRREVSEFLASGPGNG